MSSLYRRANVSQGRILRVVEGAVKNACDAHPDRRYDRVFARSVAKRAAGTLTADWPDVLAARETRRQKRAAPHLIEGKSGGRSRFTRAAVVSQITKAPERGAPHLPKAASLKSIIRFVSLMAGASRKSGHIEREAAAVEILKFIDAKRA